MIEAGKKDILDGIEIPICLFFSPDAVKEKNEAESVLTDMRELFVTVNQTAKQVSGHFLWLLNDKSISAFCLRGLANYWKGKDGNYSDCHLHLLDWNQREERKAAQRDSTNKPYSITTVSIIADCLSKQVLDSKNGGLTSLLLNLGEVQAELESNENSVPYDAICEDDFAFDQIAVLKRQISKYITPSLDCLFRRPSPYCDLEGQFRNALAALDEKIKRNTIGAQQFRETILFQFRNCFDFDQTAAKDMERDFNSLFEIDEDHEFFFTNLFQQAFIMTWAKLCNELIIPHSVSTSDIAEALVSAMEALCFDKNKRYFSYPREYTHNVFYSSESRKKVSD